MGWGSGSREEGKPFTKGFPLPFPQPPEAFNVSQLKLVA